jgi:hypothetical protein
MTTSSSTEPGSPRKQRGVATKQTLLLPATCHLDQASVASAWRDPRSRTSAVESGSGTFRRLPRNPINAAGRRGTKKHEATNRDPLTPYSSPLTA